MTIRAASETDHPRMAELDLVCFDERVILSRREIHSLLADPNTVGWVYEQDETITGFVVIHLTPSRGLVVSLEVDPAFRRQGLGLELMQHAESEAEDSGCRRMVLQVAVDNNAAIALYRGIGYRVLQRIEGYYATGESAFEMGKRF